MNDAERASFAKDRTDVVVDDRTIGLVIEVHSIQRGAKLGHPVVLDGSDDVPRGRKLLAGVLAIQAGEVRVSYKAKPDGAWVVEAEAHVGEPGPTSIETVVACADAVLALDCERIALGEPRKKLIQVQLKAGRTGPAPFVIGMPALKCQRHIGSAGPDGRSI